MSLDAMQVINWNRQACLMLEATEHGSDMQKFVTSSIKLVHELVKELECGSHEVKLSDLLCNGGVFLAIENQISEA
jgi:hypothetical protein